MTTDHFNQAAKQWDSPEKTERSKRYAEEIKNLIHKNHFSRILEVGCGTGLLGIQFLEKENTYLGIDTSEGMLSVLNEKLKDFPNARSRLLNLENENFNENNFDLILSSMAFHHLQDPATIIKKLKEKLSPEGAIAIIDLDQEDGTFHPDPVQMGVHHFGFSEEKAKLWAREVNLQMKRKIINVIHKNEKEYPVFLAIFFNQL